MFSPNFKKNTNFEADSTTDIIYDARSIQASIDYIFLKTAINFYRKVNERDFGIKPDSRIDTNAWKALSLIIQNGQDYKRYKLTDVYLIESIKTIHDLYDDIVKVLIQEHDKKDITDEIVSIDKDILDFLPDQYNKKEYLIAVMIEVIRDYQWQLEKFYQKHQEIIENLIRKIK